MSLLLSPTQIAVLALRKIGRIAWFESGGEGPAVAIAREYLDLVVAELAGTEQHTPFVPAEMTVVINEGQQQYDLAGILEPDPYWITAARRRDDEGREIPLKLITRIDWDDHEDRNTRTGTPCELYVRRGTTPLAFLYPTPNADGTMLLTGQTVSPDIATDANAGHGFETSWQLLLVDLLAIELGDGPVEKLPEQTLARFRNAAQMRKNQLVARGRPRNVAQPRKVKPDIYL